MKDETLKDVGPGIHIGVRQCAGRSQPIRIPDASRFRHVHVMGNTGMGKTVALENMVMQDIEAGRGVAVIDTHGDMTDRLLRLIPEEHVARTIHMNPGDPEYVPLFNPLVCTPGQDQSRTANSLMGAFWSIMDGWGHRLERLLRNAIYSLLFLPQATFLDVANILRKGSPESKRLIEQVLGLLTSMESIQFWRHDFERYNRADLSPSQNKLSKLLCGGTVEAMLSQPESKLDLRSIMDEGKILLCDLSMLGSDARDILGSFLLSLFHVAALSRCDIRWEERGPYFLYCDEAQRFVTSAIPDLITESRKYNLGLVFAHQRRTQFSPAAMDALAGVGTNIIFNVNRKDATHLAKVLPDKVTAKDLQTLEVGEAIARIDTQIVRIKTCPPRIPPLKDFRGQIIARSRREYCKPIAEVRRAIAHPLGRRLPTCLS